MPSTCPRCGALIRVLAGANGVFSCESCGARYRATATSAAAAPVTPPPGKVAAPSDALLAELKAIRTAQDEMARTRREVLTAVQGRAATPVASVASLFPPVVVPKVERRTRSRSVVLIDDDAKSCEAVQAASAIA